MDVSTIVRQWSISLMNDLSLSERRARRAETADFCAAAWVPYYQQTWVQFRS
jgi:hypothetical protein